MSNGPLHGSRQENAAHQATELRTRPRYPVEAGTNGKHRIHGRNGSPWRGTMLDAYRDLIDRGASSRTATIAALDVYRAYHPKGEAHDNMEAVREILGPLWAW